MIMKKLSIDILKGCKQHHTSLARGYISRKNSNTIIEEYDGKFGKGYKVHTPHYESTQYHYVTYYIKEGTEK